MRSSSTVRQVLDCFPPRDRALVQPSYCGVVGEFDYRTRRTCCFLVTTSMDIRVIERHAAARMREQRLMGRYLGLKFVSQSWFNLDATWASSLILVGALSLVISLAS